VKDIRKISRELVDDIMLKRDGVNPAAPCPENATANRYVAEVEETDEICWHPSSIEQS